MPEKKTIKKAQEAKWKQGANNTKQAIAIGLSEARRSGVVIPDKVKKTSTAKTHGLRKKAVTRKATGEKKTIVTKARTTSSKSHIAARKVSSTSTASHAKHTR